MSTIYGSGPKPHITRTLCTDGIWRWAVYGSRTIARAGYQPGMICNDFATVRHAPTFRRWHLRTRVHR